MYKNKLRDGEFPSYRLYFLWLRSNKHNVYLKKLQDGEFSYRIYFFSKRYFTNWDFEINSDSKNYKIVVIFCVGEFAVGEFVCGRIHRIFGAYFVIIGASVVVQFGA